MSITDELRKYAQGYKNSHDSWSGIGDELTAIADRIDEEHETTELQKESYRLDLKAANIAVGEAYKRGYDEGFDEGFASADDWLAQHEDAMAEHGWVRLPKDADGETIHVGDRMENNERVVRIVLTDDSWEPSVYLEKSPHVLREYFCDEISHYHAPTVEDVLREFVHEFIDYATCIDDHEVTDAIEQYAKRLKLAEEEDA